MKNQIAWQPGASGTLRTPSHPYSARMTGAGAAGMDGDRSGGNSILAGIWHVCLLPLCAAFWADIGYFLHCLHGILVFLAIADDQGGVA